MRVAVELLHIVAGLAAAIAIAMTCAWAYPPGRDAIWLAGEIAAAATLLLGIQPLHDAWAADREKPHDR